MDCFRTTAFQSPPDDPEQPLGYDAIEPTAEDIPVSELPLLVICATSSTPGQEQQEEAVQTDPYLQPQVDLRVNVHSPTYRQTVIQTQNRFGMTPEQWMQSTCPSVPTPVPADTSAVTQTEKPDVIDVDALPEAAPGQEHLLNIAPTTPPELGIQHPSKRSSSEMEQPIPEMHPAQTGAFASQWPNNLGCTLRRQRAPQFSKSHRHGHRTMVPGRPAAAAAAQHQSGEHTRGHPVEGTLQRWIRRNKDAIRMPSGPQGLPQDR